ncbi:MAG: LuxR C-terminal-related transcriptional regulator [Candidatus Zixiibacteriota bacterium]
MKIKLEKNRLGSLLNGKNVLPAPNLPKQDIFNNTQQAEIFRTIFNSFIDLLMVLDLDGTIQMINRAWSYLLGFQPVNFEEIKKRVHPEDCIKIENALQTIKLVPKAITCLQYRFKTSNSAYSYLETKLSLISINDAKYIYLATRDISKRKQIELDLQISNKKLVKEEKVLEEKNTALREILKQIDEEKKQINKQLQSNIDKLILPVLQTLYERAGDTDKLYLRFIKSCLNDITSPFINQLEKHFSRLTPRELEICNMIRSGYSSKDIASTLSISVLTVHKFRQQLRTKLGITSQKINLSSYLKSI